MKWMEKANGKSKALKKTCVDLILLFSEMFFEILNKIISREWQNYNCDCFEKKYELDQLEIDFLYRKFIFLLKCPTILLSLI